MKVSNYLSAVRFVRSRKGTQWGLALAGVVLLLAAWHAITAVLGLVPAAALPAPGAVASEFVRIYPIILQNAVPTLFETAVGFVLAVMLALVLGVVLTVSDRARSTLMPLIISGNSVPRVALAPAILFYVGTGQQAKYLIAAWMAFFPMLINTMDGLAEIDEEREMLLELLDASLWHEFRFVRFPHALPYLFDGMKVAASLAFIGAIIGEFIAADRGLGALALWAIWGYNIAMAMAVVAVTGVIATVVILTLYNLQSRIVFWREATLFGGE